MNPHEKNKLVFTTVGQMAAERNFSDDQIMRCLGVCLKLLHLDTESSVDTEHSRELIAAFWNGVMSVPWWLAGDDPGSHPDAA